jgi:hypothetical protein
MQINFSSLVQDENHHLDDSLKSDCSQTLQNIADPGTNLMEASIKQMSAHQHWNQDLFILEESISISSSSYESYGPPWHGQHQDSSQSSDKSESVNEQSKTNFERQLFHLPIDTLHDKLTRFVMETVDNKYYRRKENWDHISSNVYHSSTVLISSKSTNSNAEQVMDNPPN